MTALVVPEPDDSLERCGTCRDMIAAVRGEKKKKEEERKERL